MLDKKKTKCVQSSQQLPWPSSYTCPAQSHSPHQCSPSARNPPSVPTNWLFHSHLYQDFKRISARIVFALRYLILPTPFSDAYLTRSDFCSLCCLHPKPQIFPFLATRVHYSPIDFFWCCNSPVPGLNQPIGNSCGDLSGPNMKES